MSFSIAAIKYRNILKKNNGPLLAIEFSSKEIFNKDIGYEAYAYLDDTICLKNKPLYFLYGNADGSGSAKTKSEAIYKAISEALERWAFYATFNSQDKNRFGYDIDPSTTGMAAFPGVFKFQARRLAYREALERYALVSWWMGKLPLRKRNYKQAITAYEIVTSDSSHSVALLTRHTSQGYVYGFAAHKTFFKACQKAEIELERNAYVLPFQEKVLDNSNISILEKRLIYFSKDEGRALFEARVDKSFVLDCPRTLPKLCIDIEIVGPWSNYTTVWRCLFQSECDLKTDAIDLFLF